MKMNKRLMAQDFIEEEPTEIPIEKIKALRNVRTQLGDVSDLMTDIRENGLLHAIGVWKQKDIYYLVYGHRRFAALKKLGRKSLLVNKEVKIYDENFQLQDILVMNMTENIHRSDNTPSEFAKGCSDLREMGLTVSEIAARLSVPISKIKTALNIYAKSPEDIRQNIGYMSKGESKKGKVSATVTNSILELDISKDKIERLFKLAREKELSVSDIRFLRNVLNEGITLEQAISLLDKYICKTCTFIISKEELQREKIPFQKIMREIVKGKRRLNKKLFYQKD